MNTTTIYVSNIDWNKNLIIKCSIYKITYDSTFAVISRFQQNTNNASRMIEEKPIVINLLLSNLIETEYVMYQKDCGLFLDGLGMSENIFGTSSKVWQQCHQLSCEAIVKLDSRDCDESAQCLSNDAPSFDGEIFTMGKITRMSGIKTVDFTNIVGVPHKLVYSHGEYGNIMDILKIKKTQVNIPITIDFKFEVEETGTITAQTNQSNISFSHKGTPINNSETFKMKNGTLIPV